GDVPVWLDARSDGTKFVWQDTKTELNRNDNLWLIGDPTSIIDHSWHYLDKRISIHFCLNLAVWFDNWSERPRNVYASSQCAMQFYTLCEDCPKGYWRVEGSRQCFRLWTGSRKFTEAQSKCVYENSVLATPADDVAVALRQHLVDKYEGIGAVLLDGKALADSGQMVWQRHQTELRPDNSLWVKDELQLFIHYDNCLIMWPDQGAVIDHPTQVYYTQACTLRAHATLCEVIE
ncbi:unnamed protein product, partial [Meganyctiphanes norvegica]